MFSDDSAVSRRIIEQSRHNSQVCLFAVVVFKKIGESFFIKKRGIAAEDEDVSLKVFKVVISSEYCVRCSLLFCLQDCFNFFFVIRFIKTLLNHISPMPDNNKDFIYAVNFQDLIDNSFDEGKTENFVQNFRGGGFHPRSLSCCKNNGS